MADKVLTNNEENKDKPLIDEIREKSFEQILREQAESRNEEVKPDTTEEDKKKEEEKAEEEKKKKEEAETKAREDEQKRTEEIASKAAQEVIDKQKAEEQARLDKIKSDEEEAKRQEDLKPRFTGKDKDGNAVPLSYEELTAESVRIAEEKAVARIRAEQEERDTKTKAQQDETNKTTAQQEANKKAFEDQLQKELDDDLSDLYAADKLPKIVNKDDPNDTGNLEFKNLFETAQRVNGERIAKGLPAIRNIKLIYYEHYKPIAKPAGHDAPVMGAESSISNTPPEDKYVPARDRGKSMAQMLKEEAARLGKNLNIRGN